jgi:molybdate transport system substrate-binding protein
MRPIFFFILLAVACSGVTARAEKVSVAAAANLVYALDAVNAAFQRAEPDVELTASTGASGNLFAQIKNGAPFDVFLSADTDYPQALIKAGAADERSLTVFAVGRLALWTTRPGVSVSSVEAAVRDPAVKKIAIANAEHAPYGRAAKQALLKLHLLQEAEPKFVVGENISQTAQFVETGNADLGFVALSHVVSPKLQSQGSYLEVPADLYDRLDHAGVLTRRGAGNAAAQRYLAFLSSLTAQKIFAQFGYGLPSAAASK